MVEINLLIPAIAVFLAAALTLMTGFGLGTILTPVFLLFYDVKIAILIVAVVHLLNNLLKFSLFRRHLDTDILKRFGVLAITGAFAGTFAGKKLFEKVSLNVFRLYIAIGVIIIGVLLSLKVI